MEVAGTGRTLRLACRGGGKNYIEQELEEYSIWFTRVIEKQNLANETRNPIIRETEKQLLLEFFHPLSMEMIADKLNITPSYLSKLYKAKVGFGLIESLRDIRMAWASIYMDHGVYDIRKVAEYCGYSDSNYFGRIFRRQFGMTPSDYMIARKGTKGRQEEGQNSDEMC